MNTNTKLNLLAIAYTIGSLIFQPIASIIQVGMVTYLYRKREWRYFTYGLILLVCSIIISTVEYGHELSKNSNLYVIFLSASVFANLFWFTATIKLLKIKSLDEGNSE